MSDWQICHGEIRQMTMWWDEEKRRGEEQRRRTMQGVPNKNILFLSESILFSCVSLFLLLRSHMCIWT
jgi:hypothetical protein